MSHRRLENGTTSSPAALFGEALRFAREQRGLKQEELGKRLHCDRSLITRYESGKRAMDRDMVERADKELCMGGLLVRLWERVDWHADIEHPDWFQEFVENEGIAVGIRVYQGGMMYGPLQCRQYMRAMFESGDAAGKEEEIEELMRARLARQERMLAPDGPLLLVILDESAIRTVVGGPRVMRAQMEFLLKAARHPNIVIHVASFANRRTLINLDMVLLELPDGQRMVYSESLDRGHLSAKSETVVKHQRRYDQLRAGCLSEVDSLRLIAEALEGFRDDEQRARRECLAEEQLQRRQRRQLHRGGPRVPRPRPRT
ncbi:helix-turn-helix domain-containing protein [Streptomyces sp. NRRL WC-3742]|uniref:helix-turn-helix domain-containing protein n=1 Tax=Streptomyces sp. NRRL WC-3742 TaxID=1463934 RepID=UPI0004C63D41|nr:helix-turn-helix transcriptional regulator [Streptomyces sp. NRRL WC-3742]